MEYVAGGNVGIYDILNEVRDKVAVVKCNSYEQKKVDAVVVKSLELIDFDFSKYARKKVLIKPNI